MRVIFFSLICYIAITHYIFFCLGKNAMVIANGQPVVVSDSTALENPGLTANLSKHNICCDHKENPNKLIPY